MIFPVTLELITDAGYLPKGNYAASVRSIKQHLTELFTKTRKIL